MAFESKEFMPEFTIRKKTSSKRCEICHKTDLFDPNTSECERCKDLVFPQNSKPQNNFYRLRTIDFRPIGATVLALLAFIPGLIFPYIGFILGILGFILGFRYLSNNRDGQSFLAQILSYIGLYCGVLAAIIDFGFFLHLVSLRIN
jgi:hypothetical protein